MNRLRTIFSFFFAGALLFVPLVSFADVVPLAPLPTNYGNTQTLEGYINTIFQLTIAIGAALAVIQIVIGGFKYMTTEAVTGAKDAKSIITAAIGGLLLLLGSWLILYVINPDILTLKALSFEDLPSATSPDLAKQRAEAAQLAEQIKKSKPVKKTGNRSLAETFGKSLCKNGYTIQTVTKAGNWFDRQLGYTTVTEYDVYCN